MGRAGQLATLEKCKAQLASMTDLSDVLQVRDQAMAIRQYLKASGDSLEAQNFASAIGIRAEGRAGQLIRDMQLKSGRPKTKRSHDATISRLEELGINKSQSSRMQTIATVLEKEETWIDQERASCTVKQMLLTRNSAIRKGKELQNVELGKQPVTSPRGKYDVIVVDPPWPMIKYERDDRPNQAGFDYPTMTEDELSQLKIPFADNCHLWLWTTHKFLPMALRLLPIWDFKYVCTFVWHKDNSIQPMGLPKYNCEFALYARHGTPKFVDLKDFWCCFNAPRGAHSEKPSEFYDVVRRVTSGKRLDMFNRRAIKGFKTWGNQRA